MLYNHLSINYLCFQEGYISKGNNKTRVNEEIRSSHVRLIDENGNNVGIISLKIAIDRAKEASLDLVEVAPETSPPVCKILDFNRYLYGLQKKRKESKKKSKSAHLKQIRLSPNIDKNDLKMKFKKIKEFLDEGHKVKINMMFRGRQKEHLEVGGEILNGIIKQLGETAVCQNVPKFEGYCMSAMMVPHHHQKENKNNGQ
ncbi:MAG: translation initiation factor IF-3 [Elusimicrobia bacterium]|nr:translation initiation factor IF-3 [Elusimicrobiota bacterium]